MYDSIIVDAHQHFWDLQHNYHPWLCDTRIIPFRYGDYSSLRRNYLPDDYFADTAQHRIVKTVYVETEWNPADPVGETQWIHSIHKDFGVPNAVVAQAWLDCDDVDHILAAQASFPLVRGIRQKPRAAASAAEVKRGTIGSMSDPRWRAGYALLAQHGLSFDLQVPYWHLHEATDLAADFPETRIILNHTGLPADRSDSGIKAWRTAIKNFAQAPNVAIKISGLGLPGQPWRLEDNYPIVLDVIEIFGIDRCMFASNFPVDSIVASFDTIFNGFKMIAQEFSQEEQKKIFHDNAIKIYRI
jgi:predicted TIM-barrel fold metal-dependent hydrolase